jgi:hypothetical protein
LSAHRESSPATLTASFFFAACFLIRWWVGWDHVQSTDHGVNTVRALCSTNFGSIEGAPSQTSSVSNQVRHLLSVQTGETTVLCSASLEVLTTPTHPSSSYTRTDTHSYTLLIETLGRALARSSRGSSVYVSARLTVLTVGDCRWHALHDQGALREPRSL